MAKLFFFSTLRFTEVDGRSIKQQAAEMKKALEEYEGVFVYVCSVGNGDSIQRDICNNYDKADMCIIYGTETYGRQTAEVAISTYHEMNLIVGDQKPFFLLKMCERYQETAARLTFGPAIAYEQCLSWRSGPPPADLVAKILKSAAARKGIPIPEKKTALACGGCVAKAPAQDYSQGLEGFPEVAKAAIMDARTGECRIYLPGYDLGRMPPLNGLGHLLELDLGSNGICIELKANTFTGLENLQKLDLMDNSGISGDLASVSGLLNLTDLNLADTQVGGHIRSVSKLRKLTILFLGNTLVQVPFGCPLDDIDPGCIRCPDVFEWLDNM